MAAEIDGTSKGLLGVFAACTLISGIVSLVYGVLLLIQNLHVGVYFGVINLFTTSIILIVVGGLLIITVVLAVSGALKDISKLRLVSLVLLSVLFVVLVIVGVWAMASYKTGRLEKSIGADIKLFRDRSDKSSSDFTKQADYLKKHYNCCIVYDSNTGPTQTPETRCVDLSINENADKNDLKDACANAYFDKKSNDVFRLAILTLATAGVVLIGLLLYGVVCQRARAGYAAVSRG
ncbi:unnamed protein product [Rotaria sordida]|uniref:Tetraspanin n=1 Tax=Rotaria sordida TaxID=392033 RepID=A0A819CNX4_9BILA|nr:unnamed protein product [Rotaria sordida]